MIGVGQLKVKIFADGADRDGMMNMYRHPYVKGFTTNPTLMKKVGVSDYRAFAKDILAAIPDRPISFEVFSDDFPGMEAQAMEIASWGKNVNVKIPVTNTEGLESYDLVRKLSLAGVKVNVTAMMTLGQVGMVADAVCGGAPAYVSVFAGRIADTGRDPVPMMRKAVRMLKKAENAELIWASPRELLNIFQANEIGCHIITVTNDILNKLRIVGKDLGEYSLETVRVYEWEGFLRWMDTVSAAGMSSKWLDFGCGNGRLVRYATSAGMDVCGYDESPVADDARRQGLRILTREEFLSCGPKFDVVTAVEVFEHIEDPVSALRAIRSKMASGGVFLYTTGNSSKWRERMSSWRYVIPEIHVSYFEPRTMETALRMAGFSPMYRPVPPQAARDIIRFKVLKNLGVRSRSVLENVVPWEIASKVIDRRYGVFDFPVGVADNERGVVR